MQTKRRPILYVEDEASNRIVFEAAFETEFDVHLASSAEEALEILTKFPIPVVVADQRMPEMTGIEMFSVLRNRDPYIQRVILSGFTDSEDLIDAINRGQIYQFVRKPWDKPELLTVLYRALDAHDLALQNSILQEKLILSERCAMLGQSAARIAHEMGNQLGMLPLIETIQEEYADDETLWDLSVIARDCHNRLVDLVDEVQSLVRSESTAITMCALRLDQLLAELLSLLRFNEVIDFNSIVSSIEPDLPVVGNALKLQQVLLNLIKNASDAIHGCPNGKIYLKAKRENGQILIEISDTGCGIPEEIQSKIWEPFFTTKGKSGSGLGLDIVRDIIQSHHGEIRCESAVGAGTTFQICLPSSRRKISPTETQQVFDERRSIQPQRIYA